MKKLLSVLLTVALLLSCVSVFAESADVAEAVETEEAPVEVVPAFKLITVIPEGYESQGEDWVTPYIVSTVLKPVAEGKPAIMVIVSYNDSYSDVTFNDEMSDEEFNAQIKELVVDEETGEEMPYTVQKTGLGTRVVVIDDPDGFIEFYSIWHGYEVSLMAANFDADNNPSNPSEEQIAVIMQYLTDMDFQMIIEEAESPAV
jgi:hypothetical protein